MSLRLDWCDSKAAEYACKTWHYSRRTYVNKTSKVGVWEDGKFVGVVMYGTGCQFLGNPYKLSPFEVCELVRVALAPHKAPVSRILSIAQRMMHKANPGLRLIVSFSDTAQNHHGGIYQACNWAYVGTNEYHEYEVLGKRVPPRTLHNRYGKGGQSIDWLRANVDPKARRVVTPGKHKYLMPLDDDMRKQIAPLAKPYPKRPKEHDPGPPVSGQCNSDPDAPVSNSHASRPTNEADP